ncbi:MAG: nucleotide-binding protein [Phycisphaerales bacterium]|jgi:predicted nucleotide-binding protein
MEKQKAITELKEQLLKIEGLKTHNFKSAEFQQWHRDTKVALENIFGERDGHVYEFTWISYKRISLRGHLSEIKHHEAFVEGLSRAAVLLKSLIKEIMEFWPDDKSAVGERPTQTGRIGSDILIIHGGDEQAKQKVVEFAKELDLKAVVLHDQKNGGYDIAKNYEGYANIGFAVALLTPDEKDAQKPRARQDVVFEFGLLAGRLGRERVCALVRGYLKRPTDADGIVYLMMDDAGEWRMKLAGEIQSSGIEVSLMKLSS